MEQYDVIQVGAGHNGLIVAAYLAKAGLNVCVLEKEDIIGGGTMNREYSAPGFKDDICSISHSIIQANPVILNDELKLLSKYGLNYVYPEKCVTAIFPDDRVLSVYKDIDKTCESIEKFSRKDAEAYRKLLDWAESLIGPMAMALYNPPVSIAAMMSMLEQSEEGREMLRITQTSAKCVLDEWFESDAMKILGSRFASESCVPFDQMGTGANFFWLPPMVHRFGMPLSVGGSEALALALERCIKDHGGTIRTSCGVKKFITEGGRCKGVITEAGDEILVKRLVVSNLNIRQYPAMIDEPLPAEFLRGISRVRVGAWTAFKIDLALHNAPDWKAREANDSFLVYPLTTDSLDGELGIYQKLSRGFIVTDHITVSCQTLFDPTRAPAGKHTLYVCNYPNPYLREGGIEKWDEIKEEIAERILQSLRSYTTNMGDENIIGKHVTTPLDFARMNAAWIDGEPYHIGQWADQIMQSRPFPGWSNYRTPIEGLYMCGASCYPNAGVNGSGRSTASVIMQDLGIDFESVIK